MVAGDRDRIVDAEQLDAELNAFDRKPESHIFEGVDHFWYGHEGRLVPEIARFFIEQLK